MSDFLFKFLIRQYAFWLLVFRIIQCETGNIYTTIALCIQMSVKCRKILAPSVLAVVCKPLLDKTRKAQHAMIQEFYILKKLSK